jgi:hypothetical protein
LYCEEKSEFLKGIFKMGIKVTQIERRLGDVLMDNFFFEQEKRNR